jgi:hypothetical protein
VGFGGLFGLGEQRVAIPWSRLRVDVSGRSAILLEAREALAQAPRMPENAVHNFSEPESHALLYRMYARHNHVEHDVPRNRLSYGSDSVS